MPDSNYNNNCAFSEQTVDFLYDEINARARTVFEAHLKNCSTCADEIAGFGLVRSSVFDWKAAEFQLLKAPKIEFPIERLQSLNQPFSTSHETKNWFDGLRHFFSLSPVWTVGLVFFLILSGLFLFVQNSTNDNQIAANVDGKAHPTGNSSETKKEPTNNITENALPEPNQNFDGDLPKLIYSTEKDLTVKKEFSKNKKDKTVRASKISAAHRANSEIAVSRKIKSAASDEINDTNAVASRIDLKNKRQFPKLNNIEDEEDEATLRLSDLLDDEGGK